MTDGPAQELRRAVARSLDAELLKPVTQRVWMNIQNLRCALGAINYSIGKLKRSQDMLSVCLVEGQDLRGRLEGRSAHLRL